MRGPFGEVWDEADAVDFGSQLLNSFCIDVPWCFADYNGDGTRSVIDLLLLLETLDARRAVKRTTIWMVP